ncbi:MAG: hypothetical protein ACK5LR_01620 [Mangrovibacterium sp.]
MRTKISCVRRSIRVGEIVGLTQAILNKVTLLDDAASAHLQGLLNRIEAKNSALTVVIKEERIKSQALGDFVNLKNTYQQFYSLIKSYTFVASTKTAASQILMLLDKYDSSIVHATKIMVRSSFVKSLIIELEQAENFAFLASLMYAEGMFNTLKAAQEAFIANYADYRDLRMQQIDQPNASALRKELVEMINTELVPYLNVMNGTDDDSYLEFSDAVRGIVSGQNTIVKRRLSKASDSSATEAV